MDQSDIDGLRRLYDTYLNKLDCGDNSCLFAVKKGGMRTNGGCRCLTRQDPPPGVMPALSRLIKMLPAIIDAFDDESVGTHVNSPEHEWLANHAEELEKYAGKRIAVHATKGIVASGNTLRECIEAVRELNMIGQVLFSAA